LSALYLPRVHFT